MYRSLTILSSLFENSCPKLPGSNHSLFCVFREFPRFSFSVFKIPFTMVSLFKSCLLFSLFFFSSEKNLIRAGLKLSYYQTKKLYNLQNPLSQVIQLALGINVKILSLLVEKDMKFSFRYLLYKVLISNLKWAPLSRLQFVSILSPPPYLSIGWSLDGFFSVAKVFMEI